MTTAMLHSNEQQKTGKTGDTETGCQKPQKKTTDDIKYKCVHRISILHMIKPFHVQLPYVPSIP